MAGGGQSVLVTGARAPVALHLARLLTGAGHRAHLGDSLRAPLAAATRMKAGYHRLPPLNGPSDAVAAAVSALGVDLVIPTCEEVLYLGRVWRDHPMPVPLFAPPMALLEEVHDKHRFILLCQRLGLAVPQTRVLRSEAEVAALVGQAAGLVFKPVWSRFATRTAIRPGSQSLARIRPTGADPWVAQEFVAGEEICVYAVAQGGRVVALSSYRGLVRAGKGASVAFAPVSDAAVDRFVAAFAEGTGWTGQLSFDLIRRADGSVLPLECNPRATSGLHFFRDGAAFARAVLDGDPVRPDVTRPQGVRLALWLYGLPGVLRGRVDRAVFTRALAEVEDVMAWPGDTLGLGAQLRPVMEIAGIALRDRVGLQAASTRDIEWNGGDQSSI